MIKEWVKSGSPWIWLTASAVSTCLILVFGLLVLIAVRGLGHFWPANIVEYRYNDGSGEIVIAGEFVDTSIMTVQQATDAGYKLSKEDDFLEQRLLKVGNRDLTGLDFRWIQSRHILDESYPPEMIAIERREWGNFYGRLIAFKENGKVVAEHEQAFALVDERLQRALELHEELENIQKKDVGAINYGIERLRLKKRRLKLDKAWNADIKQQFSDERSQLDKDYAVLQKKMMKLSQQIQRDSISVKAVNGQVLDISLDKIVRFIRPNSMNLADKLAEYVSKFGEFVWDDPREANTEGGIFPAIFGTVMMVLLMSVIVTPFGVVAAVYLREYAPQGVVTRIIRISVNNLAGVPSIVYGVFGLGFFVYILGGNIDQLFYPEAAPAPVFGTPGLMWASLTLALLTLPVVIVSTEEGLSRIPKSIREGSLALGATKAETLWKTVLPMSSPAMMTGLILAVARAAGEVAPLMLVGVVKLAPTLPLDGNFPFFHLDRKFMHLGFHIYDVGFQSPNVEAARPLVYATSLLLVIVIVSLNIFAVRIRNQLREKYRALEN